MVTRGLERFGMAWSGEIRSGKVRCGEAWQERRGTVRQGGFWYGKSGRGMVRFGS